MEEKKGEKEEEEGEEEKVDEEAFYSNCQNKVHEYKIRVQKIC